MHAVSGPIWDEVEFCFCGARAGNNGICNRCIKINYASRRHRKALKYGTYSDLTLEQWFQILTECNFECFYCGNDNCALEVEHWIPMSRGGPDTKGNVVPSCNFCNSWKGCMTGLEFIYYERH